MSEKGTKIQVQSSGSQESPRRLLQLQEHRGPFWGGSHHIPTANLWDPVPAVRDPGPWRLKESIYNSG